MATPEQLHIRSALFNGSKGRSEIIEYSGVEVEVRVPTVGARGAIFKASGISGGDMSRADFGKMQVSAVIACTYYKGTSQRVFQDTDYDELMNQPSGGVFDLLANAAINLLNVKEDAAKKSETTPSVSSSTSSP
jgi:hypothetical protein